MGVILDHIKAEWDVLKGAPIAFVALLAAGVIGGFGGGCLFMSQQLANMQSLVDLKDGQIDAYRKSIEDRLDKVEKTLSAQQLSSLEAMLKAEPSLVYLGGNPTASPYATQLVDKFKDAGWVVQPSEAATEKGIILRAPDAKSSTTIQDAFSKAGVPFEAVDSFAPMGAKEFYLGVPPK